jgi:small subunit ribosomal protein S1
MQRTDLQRRRLAALVESDYDYKRPRRGEVHKAVILSIGENDMVVDLGAKRDGVVPPRDLDFLDDEYRASLEVGDCVPVVVLRTWGRHDGIVVSINKGLQQHDWLRAQDFLESKGVFEAEVTDVNRGGVVVPFGRLRGFVPNSHLTSIPKGLRGRRLREAKSKLVGQPLPLVAIEVNQRRRRLVLSERAANSRRRQQLLEELTEGDVRTGVVRSLVEFGAFVDLGGLDGLIHISELDWRHVDHPSKVLSVGEKVEVYVLNVDRERERVALSRKRLLPDPWHQVTETLCEGDVVEGTVTNIASFGVFVDLGEGVEGLVHTSEMPDRGATRRDLQTGSLVTVRVLNIDEWKRRIALRLQAVNLPLMRAAINGREYAHCQSVGQKRAKKEKEEKQSASLTLQI